MTTSKRERKIVLKDPLLCVPNLRAYLSNVLYSLNRLSYIVLVSNGDNVMITIVNSDSNDVAAEVNEENKEEKIPKKRTSWEIFNFIIGVDI